VFEADEVGEGREEEGGGGEGRWGGMGREKKGKRVG